MSYRKVCGCVAAVATALALAGGAYGDPGQNGPPGPAGNPSQPAGQSQANAPQGPAGNSGSSTADSNANANATTHGKSTTSHGKSDASHRNSATSNGQSTTSHGQSEASHGKSQANSNPGTPRKGGREDRPAGKITICHATKSVKNPYVEITISVNGLNGHGPADDPRHHAGSWKDIIPAPAGGCPSTAQQSTTTSTPTTTNTMPTPEVANFRAATAPASAQEVLGERIAGTSAPATAPAPAGASKVLGAQAAGSPPAAALAAQTAAGHGGNLPFTGYELALVLLVAAAALLGGFALRRATTTGRNRA